jgi:hypothetical protein
LRSLTTARNRRALAGVVDENVNAPELRHRGIDDSLSILRPRNVRGDGERAAPAFFDQSLGLFQAIDSSRGEHHVSTRFG